MRVVRVVRKAWEKLEAARWMSGGWRGEGAEAVRRWRGRLLPLPRKRCPTSESHSTTGTLVCESSVPPRSKVDRAQVWSRSLVVLRVLAGSTGGEPSASPEELPPPSAEMRAGVAAGTAAGRAAGGQTVAGSTVGVAAGVVAGVASDVAAGMAALLSRDAIAEVKQPGVGDSSSSEIPPPLG